MFEFRTVPIHKIMFGLSVEKVVNKKNIFQLISILRISTDFVLKSKSKLVLSIRKRRNTELES